MKHRNKVLASSAGLVAIAATSVAGASSAVDSPVAGPATGAATCQGPLDIVLTNDDGYAAPGINAVYSGLKAAGHQVTMVAPLTNQTGKSGALAYGGTLAVTQPVEDDPNIYAVAGTPADSVSFALDVLYAEDAPDLVVSGANAGTNLSHTTNHSGTVGAAVTALDRGVPAIAVSSAHPAEFERDWDGTGDMNFAGTAALVKKVVRALQRSADSCDRLMPTSLGLNINYPSTAYQGARRARFGSIDTIPTSYELEGGDTYTVGYSLEPLYRAAERPLGRSTVDYRLVAHGYASITPLDGSLSVEEPAPDAVPLVDRVVRLVN